MLGFLQQPYMFALTLAVLTAALSYLYSFVVERDPSKRNSTFFKTLAAGVVVGVGLTYLTTSRSETLAAEPFDAPPVNGI